MPGTPDDAAKYRLASGANQVLLAFDFGLRRIGVASGNLLTCTASPVTTLNVRAALPWRELDRLVDEWRPRIFVVGVPGDGGNAEIAAAIARFAADLEHRYGIAVETVDESLTSHAAHGALKDARRSGHLRRRVSKDRLDRRAACLIAEQWMNESRHEH
jgi:putative Holliday junction resolvase